MSELEVVVVGSGKRVRETALPAWSRLAGSFRVRGVFARTSKSLEAAGRRWSVRALDELAADDLAGADLVYVAVTKDAVPAVLARLTSFDVGGLDCLIDTPVVRFRHFRHAARLAAFRRAWVAEDCAWLPWIDAVRAAVAGGALGEVRRVEFERSAYAYHGVALAKALLGERRVRSGRRRSLGADGARRRLRFADGSEAHVVEPRDYARGRLRLVGTRASLGDHPDDGTDLRLAPTVEGGRWVGFRAGDAETHLDDDEVALAAGDPEGDTVVARMDALKRVGFLRLLREVRGGRGAYPLEEALDDMVVDYSLEKLGRYLATPLTSARSPLARGLLRAVSRLGG